MDADDIFLDSGFDHTSIPPPTVSDKLAIIRIALILSQKLPADIVSIILDYARLWALLRVSETTPGLYKSVDEMNAGFVIHSYEIPRCLAGSVRQLKFTTASRDQGWSDYSEFHDSYGESWSWIDVGIRNESDTKLLQLEGHDQSGYFVGAEEDQVVRQKIVTNIHAVSRWTIHRVVWDGTHTDENVRRIMNGLKGGDRIEVSMWARYPGWQNYVSFVRIEVNGVYLRKM